MPLSIEESFLVSIGHDPLRSNCLGARDSLFHIEPLLVMTQGQSHSLIYVAY